MTKTLKAVLGTFALLLLAAMPSFAQQNTLIETSLTGAQDFSQTVITLASLTGITFGVNGSPTQPNSQTILFIDNEQENVLGITGNAVHVSRGQAGTRASAHKSGAMVLAGRPVWFYRFNPSGACTSATIYVTPWLNVLNGEQWLCSSVLNKWVRGWNNWGPYGPVEVTAAVASAAGVITPSGPLFHVTGGLAITGFTLPIGFDKGGFCVIPDGTFTTTTAGNIGLISTAVVSRTLCFIYDVNTNKFYPSY